MQTLSVARRFCGPPRSANGGYFAGLLATLAGHTLRVRLLKPPPLDTVLSVAEQPDGALDVHGGEGLIAQARPARLDLAIRAAPSYVEAVEASRRFAGFTQHAYPTCFVCGPQRPRGDGMRIFAGPVPEMGLVAAPWVPDASLDAGDGKVRPELMSAALDCPGYFAAGSPTTAMLLGEITVHVNRRVHVDESCTVTGWLIAVSGRKYEVGTAVFDAEGELCAAAHALWIAPRQADGPADIPKP
jgi:hypothetical protein